MYDKKQKYLDYFFEGSVYVGIVTVLLTMLLSSTGFLVYMFILLLKLIF